MTDVEKVKQGLFRCFMKCNEPFAVGCGQCPYVGMCYPNANEYERPETAALYTDTIALIDEMQAEIERLKPRKGQWDYGTQCSVCGGTINPPKDRKKKVPFCPWCGADMRDGYKDGGGDG